MELNPVPRRRCLQGLRAVLRFNWPFYAVALLAVGALVADATLVNPAAAMVAWTTAAILSTAVLASLAGTWLAYDSGGLYDLRWLHRELAATGRGLILDAGHDEIGDSLRARFPRWQWWRGDFFHPSDHSEASIRRARACATGGPSAVPVTTTALPWVNGSMDAVILFLSAHEIRDPAERRRFLGDVRRLLAPGGVVVLVEHLRDWANTCAYTVGVGHFHRRATWLADWQAAGLRLRRQRRHRLLIHSFILEVDHDPAP